MRNSALLAALLVAVALPIWGCAHKQDAIYVQPLSTYSSMDATALIYTDPAALAPTSDHPLRWLGFLGHPVGNLMDYLINRPLYGLAELSPSLFGYTSEDAMLESQRPPFR